MLCLSFSYFLLYFQSSFFFLLKLSLPAFVFFSFPCYSFRPYYRFVNVIAVKSLMSSFVFSFWTFIFSYYYLLRITFLVIFYILLLITM